MIKMKTNTEVIFFISPSIIFWYLHLTINDIFSLTVYHCQLLECLMKYKQEVWKVSLAQADSYSLTGFIEIVTIAYYNIF